VAHRHRRLSRALFLDALRLGIGTTAPAPAATIAPRQAAPLPAAAGRYRARFLEGSQATVVRLGMTDHSLSAAIYSQIQGNVAAARSVFPLEINPTNGTEVEGGGAIEQLS
jgi:hypothetical protein